MVGKGPFYPSKDAPLLLLAAGEILKGTTLKQYLPRGRVFTVEIPDFLQPRSRVEVSV